MPPPKRLYGLPEVVWMKILRHRRKELFFVLPRAHLLCHRSWSFRYSGPISFVNPRAYFGLGAPMSVLKCTPLPLWSFPNRRTNRICVWNRGAAKRSPVHPRRRPHQSTKQPDNIKFHRWLRREALCVIWPRRLSSRLHPLVGCPTFKGYFQNPPSPFRSVTAFTSSSPENETGFKSRSWPKKVMCFIQIQPPLAAFVYSPSNPTP